MTSVGVIRPIYPSSESKLFLLQKHDTPGDATRLGTLHLNDRTPIETPHCIAISSRGVVPHLSQDTMRENTDIKGIYVALEDCTL